MKVIDATGSTLGRLATYSAKNALKGEEIRVLNCDKIIITGNKKDLVEKYKQKRRLVGSTQKGPKYSRDIESVVKTTIRGMLPNYRRGRGRVAYKKIKCYIGVPSEFENAKIEIFGQRQVKKAQVLGDVVK
ncbi:MAG: 50S ribosomal protein L13 [Candidatus Nanoarchaeia archaeon]